MPQNVRDLTQTYLDLSENESELSQTHRHIPQNVVELSRTYSDLSENESDLSENENDLNENEVSRRKISNDVIEESVSYDVSLEDGPVAFEEVFFRLSILMNTGNLIHLNTGHFSLQFSDFSSHVTKSTI